MRVCFDVILSCVGVGGEREMKGRKGKDLKGRRKRLKEGEGKGRAPCDRRRKR